VSLQLGGSIEYAAAAAGSQAARPGPAFGKATRNDDAKRAARAADLASPVTYQPPFGGSTLKKTVGVCAAGDGARGQLTALLL
jgi:hypothetical protein